MEKKYQAKNKKNIKSGELKEVLIIKSKIKKISK